MTVRESRWWEIDTEAYARCAGTSILLREETRDGDEWGGERTFSLEVYDDEHVFTLDELEGFVRDMQAFVKARRAEEVP